MNSNLVKAAVKGVTALFAIAFGTTVAKEGKKNYDTWKGQNNQKTNAK